MKSNNKGALLIMRFDIFEMKYHKTNATMNIIFNLIDSLNHYISKFVRFSCVYKLISLDLLYIIFSTFYNASASVALTASLSFLMAG